MCPHQAYFNLPYDIKSNIWYDKTSVCLSPYGDETHILYFILSEQLAGVNSLVTACQYCAFDPAFLEKSTNPRKY